ncbi:Sulfotransferase 1C3 [Amphibalanus amphitrite]|uniref:Sulfotransferase 1C3 n=1 Tax=Amphibalanus amphitrite TaxID=1232801 RepID=A0A6A4WYQ9_AMPAM|nr:Sulfotransferase 1C3 [Amphibalanus amphitrite]
MAENPPQSQLSTDETQLRTAQLNITKLKTTENETFQPEANSTQANGSKTSDLLTPIAIACRPTAGPAPSSADGTGQDDDDPEVARKLAALKSTVIPDDWLPLPLDPNTTNPVTRAYRYRGMVLLRVHMLCGLQHWAQFRGRPSDVIVASFPKSGTTWLQEIVWRVVHRETGAQSGGGRTLEYRFPLLDLPASARMAMTPLHEMESPRLIKTHLMYHLLPESVHTSGAKVLYVSRDPRDVCVSYYHFQRMVDYERYRGTFAEFRDKFVRGEVMNGPYREHVRGYREQADHVLCLTYEELHEDRVGAVRRVAEFLDKPLTQEEAEAIARHTEFENMKKNPGCNFKHWEQTRMVKTTDEGTFMRKGQVGDWRNYFTEEENDAFMKWVNEPIQ